MSIFCGNNGIDVVEVKAPNGKPSLLFNELLNLYEGNQDKALEEYLSVQQNQSAELDSNGEVTIEAYKQISAEQYQKVITMGGRVSSDLMDIENANPTTEEVTAQQAVNDAADQSAALTSSAEALVDEARDVINRQIKIYQGRLTGVKTSDRARQAANIEKLKELYSALTSSKKIKALEQFIATANTAAKNAYSEIKDVTDSINDPTKLHDNIKKLVALNEYMASYDLLDSIGNAIRRGQIKFDDSDNIAIELAEAVRFRDYVFADYNEYGIPLLAEWLANGYEGSVNEEVIKEFDAKIAKIRREGKGTAAERNEQVNKLKDKRDRMLYTKATIEKELRRASKDINSMSMWLDPAIQSGDKAIELFAKIIKDKLYEANEKDRAFEEKIGRLYDKFVKAVGKSINNPEELFSPMLEEVKVLKSRQVKQKDGTYKKERYFRTELQYVSEVDWNAYNEKRLAFLDSLPSSRTEKAKRDNMEIAWYAENTTTRPDILEFIQEKKDSTTEQEYLRWETWNIIKDKEGKIRGYKGQLVEPKKDKFVNSKYESLKGNTDAFNFYQAVVEQHKESQKLLPPKDQIGMRVPAVRMTNMDRAMNQGVYATTKEMISDATSFQATDTQYGLQNLAGEEAKTVPVFYTNEIDLKDQTRDVLSMSLKFNQMVNRYDALSEVHAEVNLLKDVIGNRDYNKVNSEGEAILDATSKKIGLRRMQKQDAYANGKASNAYKRLTAFIDMVYYGEEQKKQVLNVLGRDINMGKVADTLIKYTSANSLIGNALSAVNNIVYGNAVMLGEAIAGQHFNGASYKNGKMIYNKHVLNGDFIGDIGKTHDKSKATLLAEYFDAMQGSFRTAFGENVSGSMAKKLFSSDTLFFTQHAGEHEMQVSSMFMMLDHTKVKDKNGNTISLYDAYEVVDGKLELKEGIQFTKAQERVLRNKLHAMNRSLHGNYSDIDKAMLQRTAQGRLALMFRKFIVPGIKRRWMLMDSNIEADSVREGFYTTFFRIMIKDTKELKNFIFQNQHTLTDMEKRNIRRAIAEIGMFLAIVVSLSLVGYGDDDEDEKKAKWKHYALYELRRMQAEMSFYWNPIEAYRILRSPTATMSTLERLGRFIDQFVWTWDPDKLEYQRKSGLNEKGDNKSFAYFLSLIPILSGVRKSASPEEAIKFFN